MSNVIAFDTTLAQDPVIRVSSDLKRSVERIGTAAYGISEMEIGAEARASALIDLYEAARLIQRAAAAVEGSLLADIDVSAG
jgi:hypothetical protein